MDVKYLSLQDKVKEGIVEVEYINTHSMLADPLTKALAVGVFQDFVMQANNFALVGSVHNSSLARVHVIKEEKYDSGNESVSGYDRQDDQSYSEQDDQSYKEQDD
ncbi:hypothetical protein L3X38_043433 [Prunus dulcis]|uniref:Uncharacterized protein n=1 Tax=Prunus dulcis TaxID=3755 RepID=A0AAD4YL91_PRUDU|nr:hypothetical protein L3X38_043433 [Prunus dulcis]